MLDLVGDIRGINDEALRAKASGMIILGGGVSKHHVCNANLMRNGANFSVFINTVSLHLFEIKGAALDLAVMAGTRV